MTTYSRFPQCSFHEIVRMRAARQARSSSDAMLAWAVIALLAVVIVLVVRS